MRPNDEAINLSPMLKHTSLVQNNNVKDVKFFVFGKKRNKVHGSNKF